MIDIDDFRNDDVVIFGDDFGISISARNDRALVFKKSGNGARPWTLSGELPLDKVRSVGRVDGIAEKSEYFVVGRGLLGGANAVGTAVGAGIKDAISAAKARRQTGLVFELGWMHEPEIFIGLPDNKKRLQVIECCRQIFAGSDPEGSVRIIPEKVVLSFPSAKMLERDKRDTIENAARFRRLLLLAAGLVPIAGIIFFFNLLQAQKERSAVTAMRTYITTLQENPNAVNTAQGEACDRLRLGYQTLIEREGDAVTHIVRESVRMPRVNGSFTPSIISGLAVVIDDQNNTVRVTRNLHYYINDGRPRVLAQPLPIPLESIDQFAPVVEPTC